MWRQLYSRKGQSTGEYALVFAIILGAIIAMQAYVKRGMQGRLKEGTDYMARETSGLGAAYQYDPYYVSSEYTTERDSTAGSSYEGGKSTATSVDQSTRAAEAGEVKAHTIQSEAEWVGPTEAEEEPPTRGR